MSAAALVEKWPGDALRDLSPTPPATLCVADLLDADEGPQPLIAELMELFCREKRLEVLVEAKPLTLKALETLARPQLSLLQPELLLSFGHSLLQSLPAPCIRLCAVVLAWHFTQLADCTHPLQIESIAAAIDRHLALAEQFLLAATRLLVRGEVVGMWLPAEREEFLLLCAKVLAVETERRVRLVADVCQPRQSQPSQPLLCVFQALCRPAWLLHLRTKADFTRAVAACTKVRSLFPRAVPHQLSVCSDLLQCDLHLHSLRSLQSSLGTAPSAALLDDFARRCAAAGRPVAAAFSLEGAKRVE